MARGAGLRHAAPHHVDLPAPPGRRGRPRRRRPGGTRRPEAARARGRHRRAGRRPARPRGRSTVRHCSRCSPASTSSTCRRSATSTATWTPGRTSATSPPDRRDDEFSRRVLRLARVWGHGGPVNLHDWIDELSDVLDVEAEVDEGLLADLTKVAAHNVEHMAAPVTAYLLGFAAASHCREPRAGGAPRGARAGAGGGLGPSGDRTGPRRHRRRGARRQLRRPHRRALRGLTWPAPTSTPSSTGSRRPSGSATPGRCSR